MAAWSQLDTSLPWGRKNLTTETPAAPRRRPVYRWIKLAVVAGLWAVAIFLAVAFVRRDAFKYVEWSEAVYQRFWPNRILLAAHVVGAGIALLLGPLQFSNTLRKRIPAIHRGIGWIYVLAVLISTPFAVRLSFHSGCPRCIPPFVIWGIVTTAVTLAAVITAVMRNLGAHREFMMRSYALMFGFVWVRLDVHLIGTPLEIPLPSGVPRNSSVIWLCWVVPLILVEAYVSWWPALRRSFKRRSRRSAA